MCESRQKTVMAPKKNFSAALTRRSAAQAEFF